MEVTVTLTGDEAVAYLKTEDTTVEWLRDFAKPSTERNVEVQRATTRMREDQLRLMWRLWRELAPHSGLELRHGFAGRVLGRSVYSWSPQYGDLTEADASKVIDALQLIKFWEQEL